MKNLSPRIIPLLLVLVAFIPCQAQTAPVTGDFRGEADLTPALDPIRAEQLRQAELIESLIRTAAAHDDRLDALETGSPPPEPPPPDPDPDPDPGEPGEPGEPSADGYGAINLAQSTYYSTQWAFADLFLQSDAWRDDGTAYIYANGHPPPGRYALTWDASGGGSIDVTLGGENKVSQPGRVEFTVHPGASIIQLKRSGGGAGGAVTDCHIRSVTAPGDSSFHPLFVERLRGFRVIRFMDWMRTNHSPIRTWSDRPTPGMVQTSNRGVALEYMVELANTLKADPWFCMPHQADDDYVRRFAEYVRNNIHPGATVYVEYSNECWNSQFSQSQYLEAQAGDLYAAWAREAARDFAIWSDVMPASRLKRVLAVQLANPDVARRLIDRLPADSFDVLSPSAYFGLTSAQFNAANQNPGSVTVDSLVATLRGNIETDNARWYAAHAALIANIPGVGVELIAYEAGQHVDGRGIVRAWADKMIALQKDPRIIDLYHLNMETFEAAGGTPGGMAAFNYVEAHSKQWGAWGHLEYQDQPISDAPKYRAITIEPETPE